MAFSCKSAALLSGHLLESETTVAAEKFGYHFGLAFQVSYAPAFHAHLPSYLGWEFPCGRPSFRQFSVRGADAVALHFWTGLTQSSFCPRR
jgi:hypothetical protein